MSSLHRLAILTLVGLLAAPLVAGCTPDDPDATPDAGADADEPDAHAEPDTDPDPDLCAPFEPTGPYAVGLQDTTLPDGTPLAIFYPTTLSQAERDALTGASYDMRDFLPEGERDLISDEDAPRFAFDAFVDAPVNADGPFPVVLFSHGLAGYRFQSSTLLTHIASWGFVVASAEHPGRNLTHVLENLVPADDDGPEVFQAILTYLEDAQADAESPFAGLLDLSRIASTGHSMGGGAARSLIPDDRVGAAVFFASGASVAENPHDVDLFWMAGATDAIATSASIEQNYNNAPTPRRFLDIQGAGHLAFSDICAIGADRGGVLQIAVDAGINVPPIIQVLGNDGCRDTDLAVELTWPLIHHYTVAHIRNGLGIDAEPVGLSHDTVECFQDVTALDYAEAR